MKFIILVLVCIVVVSNTTKNKTMDVGFPLDCEDSVNCSGTNTSFQTDMYITETMCLVENRHCKILALLILFLEYLKLFSLLLMLIIILRHQ